MYENAKVRMKIKLSSCDDLVGYGSNNTRLGV